MLQHQTVSGRTVQSDLPSLAFTHIYHYFARSPMIRGATEPLESHGAAMQQLVRMFPDVRVHTPYPVQFGGDDWITVVTNVTGTFTGEMTLPDGNIVPPTGKAFDLEFAQTSKWAGDQLIVISAFWDSALQRQQIGLA